MKTRLFTLAALSLASSMATVQAQNENSGTAPTLNIISPTAADGVLYLGTFPTTVPILYTVIANGGSELKDLTQLDVKVNDLSLYGGKLNPFDNNNACDAELATLPNTCNVSSATEANLSSPWTITKVGEYTIVVTARHRSATGTDEETVTVALLSAEYPAPPAVANAYINGGAGGLPLTGKQRGCVISKIAMAHGQNEAYGPKGGPYNVELIHSAVGNFATICPAR